MQGNDPVPARHRAASPGAVIGVPACTAKVTYGSSLGVKYPGGLGAEPMLSASSRSI